MATPGSEASMAGFGATKIEALVPFGRLVSSRKVRPTDWRNIQEIRSFLKTKAKKNTLHQYLGIFPMAKVTANFLKEGPGITLPLQRSDAAIPHMYGSPGDRVHYIIPTAGKIRESHETHAIGADSAAEPFLITIIDGAHRLQAGKLLAADPEVTGFTTETMVLVVVEPIYDGESSLSDLQAALEACESNMNIHTSRTFAFDEIYGLAAVRDAALTGILSEVVFEKATLNDATGRTPFSALVLDYAKARRKTVTGLVTGALPEFLEARSRLRLPVGKQLSIGSVLADAEAVADSADAVSAYLTSIARTSRSITFSHAQVLSALAKGDRPEAVSDIAEKEGAAALLALIQANVSDEALRRFKTATSSRTRGYSDASHFVNSFDKFATSAKKRRMLSDRDQMVTAAVRAEARSYLKTTTILALPMEMLEGLEEPAVADSLLGLFPNGLAARGIPPTLPLSVLKLVARNLCYTACMEEANPSGRRANERSFGVDGNIQVRISSWANRAHLWRFLLPTSKDSSSDDKGDLSWRRATEVLWDDFGWSFGLFVAILARQAAWGKVLVADERITIAVLAAWQTALQRVLGFKTLAGAVAPFCLSEEFSDTVKGKRKAGWHLTVPTIESPGVDVPLAPKSTTITFIRKGALGEGSSSVEMDTRRVHEWADSCGVIVRSETNAPPKAAFVKEASLARTIVEDAFMAPDIQVPHPHASVTIVPSLLSSKYKGTEKETDDQKSLVCCLTPETWSGKLITTIAKRLSGHPRIEGRFSQKECEQLLRGEAALETLLSEKDQQDAGAAAASEEVQEDDGDGDEDEEDLLHLEVDQIEELEEAPAAEASTTVGGRKRKQSGGETGALKRRAQLAGVVVASGANSNILSDTLNGVLKRVLDKLANKVMIVHGKAEDVVASLDYKNFASKSQRNMSSLQQFFGSNVTILPFEAAVCGAGKVSGSPSPSSFTLLCPSYGGIQLLMTDPPFGILATETGSSGSGTEEGHDRALSRGDMAKLFQGFRKACTIRARAAVFLSEALLPDWKDAMSAAAPTPPGAVGSPPESLVIAYDEPTAGSGNRRRRGDHAPAPLRCTEFILNSKIGPLRPATSRKRDATSGPVEEHGTSVETVNFGGATRFAGYPCQRRDWGILAGAQRPAADELISAAFMHAFSEVSPELAEHDGGDGVGERVDVGFAKLRFEQKSEFIVAELLERFLPKTTTRDTVVLDPFAGTLTTALASLSLGKEGLVIVSDSDKAVLEAGRARLVIRALYLSLVGGGAFHSVAQTLVEKENICCALAWALLNTKTRGHDWGALPGGDGPLPLFPTMPKGMAAHFTESMPGGLRRVRVPPEGHPFAGQIIFAEAIKNTLIDSDRLAVAREKEATSLDLAVRPSVRTGVDGVSVGLGVFTTREFKAGEILTSFYGAYSFAANTRANAAEIVDGWNEGGSTGAFVKRRFGGIHSEGKWQRKNAIAASLPKKLPYLGSTGTVWVAPAPWNVAGYVNDPRVEKEAEDEDGANVFARCAHLEWLAAVIDAEEDEEAERLSSCLVNGKDQRLVEMPEETNIAMQKYYKERLPPAGWDVKKARQFPLCATREVMQSSQVLELVAKRDIHAGEEVLFNYGCHHDF